MDSNLRQRGNLGNGEYNNEIQDQYFKNNDKKSKGKLKRTLNGLTIIPLLFIFYGGLFYFVHFRLNSLPVPIGITSSKPTDFVEEIVRNNLDKIVVLGPRVTGSAANLKAKDVIIEAINDIEKTALQIHNIEVDTQTVTGDFKIDFLAGHFTSVYSNLNNVVVRFSRRENPSNHSLLVNCHYDTFMESPGASDDAVSCCVMLELLRVFSQHKTTFKHSIIFLFNGAEENILQASHGFITQHPWGKTIRTFINLEATGAGGWEMVFQTGPENPWLIKHYINSVKYPSASIFSQEIFQSGKIPGDTDFRIFRDYGKLAGLDIAHIKNGYVYHTSNDLPKYIQPGSIQRGGENLKNVIVSLISSKDLEDPGVDRHGNMVFFDFIGFFMISYPMRMAVILNVGISSLFLLIIVRKIINSKSQGENGLQYFKDLIACVLFLVISWAIILVMAVCMALFVTSVNKMMSWYTNTSNIVFLYILPSIIAVFSFHLLLQKTFFKTYSGWKIESLMYEANMVLFTCILLLLTYFNIASACVILMLILFPMLVRNRTAEALKLNYKDESRVYIGVHLLSILIPASYVVYFMYLLSSLVLGVAGRTGTEVLPDIIIAMVISLPIVLLLPYHISVVYVSRNIEKCLVIVCVICLTGIAAILFTSLGFPYSSNKEAPSMQRLYFAHYDRIDHKLNGEQVFRHSNIWHVQLDYYGIRNNPDLSPYFVNATDVYCDVVYCGMPYLFPVLHMIDPRKTLQVSAPRLDSRYERAVVKLLDKEKINMDTIRMSFEITGPDHIASFISPVPGVVFKRWSLEYGEPFPIKTLPMFTQPTYYIYYSYETKPKTPFTFSITINVGQGFDINNQVLEYTAVGHYLHGEKQHTPQLSQLVQQLPPYTVNIAQTSTVDFYQF